MSDAPSPFSKHNPKHQIAWDSTSLRAFQFCPRSYQYGIVEGWSGSSIDLEFGIIVHEGIEVFARERAAGASVADAQRAAVRRTLEASGNYDEDGNWIPWGGFYEEQWRCKGTEKYKNEKGNAAKCPYSHKGKWFPEPAPSVCGECGSEIEQATNWEPFDSAKDRYSAVRLVAWYCEEQPSDKEAEAGKGVQTYTFPNGEAAVELPFRIPLAKKNKHGEAYMICGYLDRIGSFGGELFTVDAKTTKKTLNRGFFNGYNPSTQFDMYDLAGTLILPDLPLKGVMIDAMQTMAGGARFGIKPIYRTEDQREEFYEELQWWLDLAEKCAEDDYWPMNRANCWLCGFKGICSKEASKREMFLKADFNKRHWNPLEER